MGVKAFSGLSQEGVKVALKTASRVCVNIYGISGGHYIFSTDVFQKHGPVRLGL
jgi:hypothetical protein